MKHQHFPYGEEEMQLHAFLTYILDNEWSASFTGHFTPGFQNPKYPVVNKLGRNQNWTDSDNKISPSVGNRSLILWPSSP
jgi:hypothetical protein